jgi:hypothetical protein
MFKEVKDALLLTKTGDEVEIGLTILDTVFSLLIFSLEAKIGAVSCDAALLKDLFDDVFDFLVLKDPAVLFQGEKPESGNDLRLIEIEPSLASILDELTEDAMKVTVVLFPEQGEQGFFPHHLIEFDLILRDQGDMKRKE